MTNTPEECNNDAEAIKLAQRMAKAAGKQKADVMGRACYLLLCCAALVKDADAYFDWLDLMNDGKPLHSCANAFSQHPGICANWCGDARTCPQVEQAESSGVRASERKQTTP